MDICPVGDEPTTASVTYFIHGAQERIEQELKDGKRVPLEKSKYRALACHKKEETTSHILSHLDKFSDSRAYSTRGYARV